jgi:hypothetical protein
MVGKHEGNGPREGPSRRWKNIEMDLDRERERETKREREREKEDRGKRRVF